MNQQHSQTIAYIVQECHQNLQNDSRVYDYLSKQRKLTDETIRKFTLGAFPSALKKIVTQVDPEILKQLKIAWVSAFDGQGICKFRDHYPIIIPIYDPYGSPIAIMGRFLGSESERSALGIHKYDNSDYPKHSTLFALHHAIPYIRKHNKVLVSEGFLDTIACHQYGIGNSVATGGAFIKQEQIATLARYTENICVSLDNDEPGDLATERALKIQLPNIHIKDKRPPRKYKDMDEYLTSKRGGG